MTKVTEELRKAALASVLGSSELAPKTLYWIAADRIDAMTAKLDSMIELNAMTAAQDTVQVDMEDYICQLENLLRKVVAETLIGIVPRSHLDEIEALLPPVSDQDYICPHNFPESKCPVCSLSTEDKGE